MRSQKKQTKKRAESAVMPTLLLDQDKKRVLVKRFKSQLHEDAVRLKPTRLKHQDKKSKDLARHKICFICFEFNNFS